MIPGAEARPVLLFDSTCVMCSRLVPWIIAHEVDRQLFFAGLQSETAALVLMRYGITKIDFDTMYVIENARVYTRSDAVARFARHLRWPWRAIALSRFAPRWLRDVVYRWVARNRHHWFGTQTECAVPSPAVRNRFLA